MFPVDSAPAPGGDIAVGTLPAGRHGTLTHHGRPDKLFDAITRLRARAAEQGLVWGMTAGPGRGGALGLPHRVVPHGYSRRAGHGPVGDGAGLPPGRLTVAVCDASATMRDASATVHDSSATVHDANTTMRDASATVRGQTPPRRAGTPPRAPW